MLRIFRALSAGVGKRRPPAGALLVALIAASSVVVVPAAARAQGTVQVDTGDPLARAMLAEDRHDINTAALAYRQVLERALVPGVNDGDRASIALLGLERVWTEAGLQDSLMVVVERVLQVRRSDPIARGIQLRSLLTSDQDEAARRAFLEWRRAVPLEAAPYREYARLLLGSGRAKSADTILTEAARQLGNSRDISGEIAQLNAALERWPTAAQSYRNALKDQPWLENAGIFALQRTPVATRDSVRRVLSDAPVTLGARRMLSEIELTWSEPRRAWQALADVPVDDSTIATWRAFGERVEGVNWPVARDAWTAVMEKTGDLGAVQRAANAAIQANDAAGALAIIARGSSNKPAAQIARTLLPVEVAALSELGRAAEAQKLIDENKQYLDDGLRAELLKPLVGAWLRAGNVEQARLAATNADLSDDDETAGWLALYRGDLVTARKRLVRVDARRGSQIEAMAVLTRTKESSSPGLGAAFLSLARRDTALAVSQFVAQADTLLVAAPSLLATAARLEEARTTAAASARAIVIWKRIVAGYPKSAEAPEASLTWAQSLARSGDIKGAIVQMEAMLVDYSDSAFAPQARRELEKLRGQVPPGGI